MDTEKDIWYLKMALVDVLLAIRNVAPLLQGEAKREVEDFCESARYNLTQITVKEKRED